MSNLGHPRVRGAQGAERDALMRDLLGLRMSLTLVGVLLAPPFALAAGYSPALLAGTVLASLGNDRAGRPAHLTIPLTAALRLGALSLLDSRARC